MVNWKKAGLVGAVGVLMYTTWCASPVKSQSAYGKPVFFSGHYQSPDPSAEGVRSFSGVSERMYNDSILYSIWLGKGNFAGINYSNPPVMPAERQAIAKSQNGSVLVEVHSHGGHKGCVSQYSPDSSLSGEGKALAESLDKALLANGVRTGPLEEVSDSYVLNNAEMPSAIVNCGNIRSKDGEEWIMYLGNLSLISKSLVDGAEAYLKK